ncbi:MAG TPA: hypothetical protein VM509_05230, partial [Planctomycetota bacterium]|nr:hypothetical protein [Planctomycetota bacterium]
MEQEPDPSPALPSAAPRDFVHELNNLLTVVLSNAESALLREDPAEMREALQVIADTAASMASVT